MVSRRGFRGRRAGRSLWGGAGRTVTSGSAAAGSAGDASTAREPPASAGAPPAPAPELRVARGLARHPAVRVGLAVLVAAVVFGGVVGARVPVGAGTYYDDGIYLALAESLAEGEGYTYANLPGTLPGVKYPPIYPAVLAVGLKAFGPYPASLPSLKAVNAAFYAAAAGLTFLLFAGGGIGRRVTMAAVTAGSFVLAPGLFISTVLLSEPLFLLLAAAALLCAQARERTARSPAWRGGTVLAAGSGPGRYLLLPGTIAIVCAAALAGVAGLTRSIGVVLVVAIAAGEAIRRRPGRAGLAALVGAAPLAAWAAWVVPRAETVPEVIRGFYGAFPGWYADEAFLAAPLARVAALVGANAAPLVETLRAVWVPRAPLWAAIAVLVLAGIAALVGLRSVWRRNPALALFVPLYLVVVLVWPYEPYRFYYALVPLLTLLVAEGAAALLRRYGEDLPAAALAAAGLAVGVLVLAAAFHQVRSRAVRAWAIPQTVPAAAYHPTVEWLRANTPPDAVIASDRDPYIYWATRRQAVPAWDFDAGEHLDPPEDAGRLAAAFERIRRTFRPGFVAILEADNEATRTVEAYAERHPERIELVFRAEEETAAGRGAVYRLDYPGPG